MKGLYKYEVTVYEHNTGDEVVHKGVVYGKNFGDAVNKVVKDYEYYGENSKAYDVEICDITVSPVIDEVGKVDDIYEIEEVR